MKALSTLAIILSVILLISCSEDDVQKQKVYPKVALNIAGAQTLAVTQDHETGRVAQTVTNFYKVTGDGSLETVKYIYPDGGIADSAGYSNVQISVKEIHNLNSEYVLLGGSFVWPDTLGQTQSYQSLLVRKADGAMYDFASAGYFEVYQISAGSYRGESKFKKDGAGKIYLSYGGIFQMQLDNPEHIALIPMLPSGQYARYFEVSSDGLIMYEYNQNYNDFRIKSHDGGITRVDIPGRQNLGFWTGTNGALYLLTSGDYGINVIHQISSLDGEIIIKDVWSGYGPDWGNHEKILMENSVLFINPENPQGSWEFSEEDNTVTNINLPFAEVNSKLTYSNSYYYIATSDGLYKIDKSNHTYTSLLGTNQYELYTLNVDNTDKVMFSGLRFKDGRKLFAEIDKDGVLTIIDEELNQAAVILQRIN